MSARSPKRNNVMAGLFLVAALVLGVVLSFWVSNFSERFGEFTEYVVAFTLREGANGIEPGSPVLLGGKNVGRVVSVDWARGSTTSDGRSVPDGVKVRIKIRQDVPLYSNAIAQVERPILGGLAAINVTDPGGPDKPAPGSGPASQQPHLLAQGDEIDGMLAPGLLAQAGLGPEEVQRIKSIIAQVDRATADVAQITGALAPNAEPTVEDLTAIIASARRTTENFESDYKNRWSPRVTSVLDRADRISDQVEQGVGDVRAGIDEARSGIEDARTVFHTSQDLLNDFRPQVQEILDDVRASTEHFKQQTTADVDKLMTQGQEALAEFKQFGASLNTMLAENRPNVDQTLSNARLVSMDARLFLDEIRAQPQRLLRPPNKKETQRELLYSSARAYASAVSNLRATSESLDNVLQRAERGDSSALDAQEIMRLQQKLQEQFANYQKAEQKLLDAILEKAPKP